VLLQFNCEFFWRKKIGEKTVHKMLMKLTTSEIDQYLFAKRHAILPGAQILVNTG